MTTVKLLTPPGTGAIAVLEVRGPDAWRIVTTLFQPAKRPLPHTPQQNQRWFGTLANDDVILAVTGDDTLEIHTHGGRAVVTLIQNQLLNAGCAQAPPRHPNDPLALLPQAKTLRTAGILLDQCNGAFDKAIRETLSLLDQNPQQARERIQNLVRFYSIGRHLVEPWTIAIVGAPNVGKSSLVNALAGFERTLVSPIPGTTRDAVCVTLAFDGWPVELIDTAGQRGTDEELEVEGIRIAQSVQSEADRVIFVIDGSDPESVLTLVPENAIGVLNKCDKPIRVGPPGNLFAKVSAKTGEGIAELVAVIVESIAWAVPEPGEAVPYTADLVSKVISLCTFDVTRNVAEARTILTSCLVNPP